MKKLMLACCLFAGCTDRENLGNTGPALTSPVLETTRWAITLGGTGEERAMSVAIDSAGDVIAIGDFQGTVDFGDQTLTSSPQYGGWVSKRSGVDGHALWTLGFATTDPGGAAVNGISVGPDDAVFITGSYRGDLHLEEQVFHSAVTGSSFVAKYDRSGHLVWARSSETSGGISIAVARDGRIAVTGSFLGTIQFPNATFTETEGGIFVALLDASGQPLWGQVGTSGAYASSLVSVAITNEDDVIVSGTLEGHATVAGSSMTANAKVSQFAARFTVDGHTLWTRVVGTPGVEQQGGPVLVDSTSAPILTSTTRADTNTNGLPKISSLDPNGHDVWSSAGVAGSAALDAATVLADGTVVIGGATFGSTADLGGGTLDGCMYLAAHDASGNLIANRAFGQRSGTCTVLPWGLATGPSGAIAFAGLLSAPVDFGTGTVRFAGKYDAMIVMLDTAP